MRQSPFVPLLGLAGGFAIVPPALIHFVGGDKVHLSSTVHFWAVGLSASIAIAAGVALSPGGKRRRAPRATSAAFTVAGLLVVHALPTGVVVGATASSRSRARPRCPSAGILALRAAGDPGAHGVVPLLWLRAC